MIELPGYRESIGVCLNCEVEKMVREPIWLDGTSGYCMFDCVAGETMLLKGPLCDECYEGILGLGLAE